MIITLNARLSSALNWDREIALAKEAGVPITWEIDLGLTDDKIDLLDPTSFNAFSIAIEFFTKHVFPQFEQQKVSFGKLNYGFEFSPELQERFMDFAMAIYHTPCLLIADLNLNIDRKALSFDAIKNNPGGRHLIDVYALTILSEYLHRLIAFLPESIEVIGSIDETKVERKSHLYQLLSKERFPHLRIAEVQSETSTALCLPGDQALSCRILDLFDGVLETLEKRGVKYRVVSEFYLTEEWDGIDQLIVLSDALSPLGKRKLQGFIASGGDILSIQTLDDLSLLKSEEDLLKI